jgi:hypothetical protein
MFLKLYKLPTVIHGDVKIKADFKNESAQLSESSDSCSSLMNASITISTVLGLLHTSMCKLAD